MNRSPLRFPLGIVAGFLSTAVLAQAPPLFAEIGEPLPDGMSTVIGSADYDGDGDIDLFTTTGVFLNSLGFFTPGPKLPSSFLPASNVRSIAVADLTGDGFPDVLVGRGSGAPPGLALFIAPAPGGQTFVASPASIGGSGGFQEFAVADFDGDGDVDIIAAFTPLASPQWNLILNNGGGVFTLAPANQWPAGGTTASWVGAGDFDGDGWIDVFASQGSGNAVWRRNLGGGFFGPTQVLASLVAESGAVGDFDGDGDDDVLVVDAQGNELIHQGTPAGLVAGIATVVGPLCGPPLAVDIDGDGDAELLRSVASAQGSPMGSLFYRLGQPGGLGPMTLLGPIAFGYGNPSPYVGAAAGDFDGDGDRDLALVPGGQAPSLLINGGTAGVVLAPKLVPPGFQRPFAPPRDVDGDGFADLVVATPSGATVSLFMHRNDGRGVFSPSAVAAGSFPSPYVGRPVWADLDNDGDSDLYVTSSLSGFPDVALLNNGAGVFSTGATVTGAGAPAALAAGDLDGDLDVDIVIGRGTMFGWPPIVSQPVLVFANLTPAGLTYAPGVPFGLPEVISDVELFDSEPDGDLDLLMGTVTGAGGAAAPPRIYLNNGLGAFSPMPTLPGTAARTVAAGDLNGDGFTDLVLGSQSWLNTGLHTYALHATHPAPLGFIALADLDGDGDLDLTDSAGRWYANDGTGTFGTPNTFVGYPPYSQVIYTAKPTPIDLDGDGDLDLTSPLDGPPAHYAIYWNLTRQAGRTSLVSQGAFASVAVFGAPSASWLLAASSPGWTPQAFPPLGTLFLDLGSTVIVTGGVLPPSGRSDVTALVPANPALAGNTLSWQALVGAALTNGFDTTVLP
jgi:hypothetical protein